MSSSSIRTGQKSSMVQKCKHPGCQVLIRHLLYLKTGKTAPIEARPSEDGNIHIDLEQDTYLILVGEELTRARERGVPLHCNHFMKCEFARQFAKPTDPTMPAMDKSYYLGILAALAVVAARDLEVVYHEIIASTNEAELVRFALTEKEILELSGLIRFGYVKDGQHVESDARQLALV